MKKKTIALTLLLLGMSLCSCKDLTDNTDSSETDKQVVVESDSSAESVETVETIKTTETNESTVQVVESETKETIDHNAAWENRFDVTANGLASIPNVSVVDGRIAVSGEGYEELSQSIDEVSSEQLASGAAAFDLKRCDNRVFSYSVAYPDFGFEGCNFDYKGNRLSLKDVITDYDAFSKFFYEYETIEYPYTIDSILQNTVSDYIGYLPELDKCEKESTWFFDCNSLVFWFGGDRNHFCYLHIPYTEIAGWIKGEYLPGDGAMIADYAGGTYTSLSGNTIESLAMEYDAIFALNATVDGIAVDTISTNSYARGPATYYGFGDGREFILLCQSYSYDDNNEPLYQIYNINLSDSESWTADKDVVIDYSDDFVMPVSLDSAKEYLW